MATRNNWLSYFFITLLFMLAPDLALADEPARPGQKPPQTRYSLSYTPLYQTKTDLDSGGSFAVQRHFLRFNATRFFNRQWMVGLGLRFDYEYWDFSAVKSLYGIDLWDEIYRPGISVPVFYRPNKQWRFGVIPSIEWAGTTGAEAGESLSYGAAVMAAYAIRPTLTVGLGGGVFERLGETVGYVFPVVTWKINEQWQLTNPFEAGPVGPAGLEVSYRPNDNWEMGVGGAYRSYRFRLDDSSTVADGIGQVDFWAPFARIGRRLGKQLRLDLNGGATLDGKIIIEDKDARHIGETGYDTAPFLGLTLKGKF
jgi:hypothetical protein